MQEFHQLRPLIWFTAAAGRSGARGESSLNGSDLGDLSQSESTACFLALQEVSAVRDVLQVYVPALFCVKPVLISCFHAAAGCSSVLP